MGVGGRASRAIDACVDGGKDGLMRTEREGLETVLQKNADGREIFVQGIAKFRELEFVDMERVRTVLGAGFGIVEFVRRRNQKKAARTQNAAGFSE